MYKYSRCKWIYENRLRNEQTSHTKMLISSPKKNDLSNAKDEKAERECCKQMKVEVRERKRKLKTQEISM